MEPLGRDRLQEVVDGVDLEGAQRVAVERRDEDDGRRRSAFQHAQDAEAVEAGHLDVQEQEIRTQVIDRLDCLESVLALRDDLDLVFPGQLLPDPLARQRLVVHENRAYGHDETRSPATSIRKRAREVFLSLFARKSARGASGFLNTDSNRRRKKNRPR